MALTVIHDVDEEAVAKAIMAGDLQLEHILQHCFESETDVDFLIRHIEALGGTRNAGRLAAKFVEAMIQS